MSLPPSVKEIAEVIGRDNALYLIGQLPRAYGGSANSPKSGGREGNTNKKSQRVIMYVPKRLTIQDKLVTILGWGDAEKLVRVFGGMLIHPATCADIYITYRNKNIVRLRGEGVPAAMVAEWFGVTERHVRNIVAEIPPHDQQPAANDNARTVNKKRAGK